MDKRELEGIFNGIFADLQLLYRDTELDEKAVSKYFPTQILKEVRFTDMSFKKSRPLANCRYLIGSAQAKNLSEINPYSRNFGHMVLPRHPYFKGLDVYQLKKYHQIWLLHIPFSMLKYFTDYFFPIEKQLIQKARADFQQKVQLPADPYLN